MTHEEIEARNLVERYVLGKISPDDSERFEAHFVDCPVCLEGMEAVERFRAALKPLAGEPAPSSWPVSWSVAAGLVLALGSALFLAVWQASTQRELQEARRASLDWRQRYEREHAATAVPPLLAPTFSLSITRGSDANEVNRVTIPNGSQWLVLSLEGEVDAGITSLRAVVADSSGKSVWRQNDVPVRPHETLSVILPSVVLRPGDYVLTLEGLSPDGRYLPAGRYRFRAALPVP